MARFVSCPHKPDTAEINRLFHNLDHESDVASESEAESASDTESEESDEEALKKERKKNQGPAREQHKPVAQTQEVAIGTLAPLWYFVAVALCEHGSGSEGNRRKVP